MYEREKPVEALLGRLVKDHRGMAVKLVPSVSGLPDRLVLLPGGRLVFVETKSPTGTVRPHQTVVHEKLRRLGFTVVVLSSQEQVRQWAKQLDPAPSQGTNRTLG